MEIGLYDSYDDDGQLSMFREEEMFGEETSGEALPEEAGGSFAPPARPTAERTVPEAALAEENNIRVGRCASCGKLLSVREEEGFYFSECGGCGVRYTQKKQGEAKA